MSISWNTQHAWGINRILSKAQSFWSCSHMKCCLYYMLHINLHILYSLWSLILATLYSTQKIFHGKFQNQKRTTQALSVYRKGTFHIYYMFDCHFLESYNQKMRFRKKVMLWCTGLSKQWNLGMPLMRRHPHHAQGRERC